MKNVVRVGDVWAFDGARQVFLIFDRFDRGSDHMVHYGYYELTKGSRCRCGFLTIESHLGGELWERLNW